MDDYHVAYNKFFQLKGIYENKFRNFKHKLNKSKIDIIGKKIKIEDYLAVRKCVNCNKVGGTVFDITEKHLKARCNVESPCSLDINIELGDRVYMKDNIYEKMEENINSLKQKITKDKLKLLFDLDVEDVVVRSFENTKKELIDQSKIYSDIKRQFDSVTQVKLEQTDNINALNNIDNDEMDNDDEKDTSNDVSNIDGVTTIKRSILLKTYENDLIHHINEYKKRIALYKKQNDENILEEAMRDYVNIITPLKDKIRKTKYSSIHIDENVIDKKTIQYHISKNKKDIHDLITSRNNNKVISNKY
tara:strand:- start:122 stop:1033 length:912 start_codon:yes stop_codon:yes gene_type:complete